VPAGYVVPTATINTLGDITAACINSGGGVAGNGSACGTLFTLTTPPNGVAPTNTVAALLNLADDPTLNTTQLYDVPEPQAPFQPQLTAVPSSFAIGLEAVVTSLQVTPASISFPYTAVGSTAVAQTVTLLNNGNVPVSTGSVSIMGTNASEFAETTTCGAMLLPGGSCTVAITATPAQPGVRNASVQAGGSTVPLSVPGVAPGTPGNLSITGGSVNAGSWTIAGGLEDFILSNPGTTPVTIGSIQTGTQYFSIAGSTCGSLLAGGSSCAITVQSNGNGGSHTTATTYTDSLTITDSAANSPQAFGLTSTNQVFLTLVPTNSQISTPVIVLGTAAIGNSQSQGINGDPFSFVPVPQTTFYFSGQDPQDFSYTYGSAVDVASVIPCDPSGNCAFSVNFSPTAVGNRTAQMMFYSLPTGPTEYLNVSGSGQAAGPSFVLGAASVSTAYLAGNGTAGTGGSVMVTNNGTTTINPTSVSVTGPSAANFTTSSNGCAGLAPLATCQVFVTFSAMAIGPYSATLVVTDSSLGLTVTTPLNVIVGYSNVMAAPAALDLNDEAVGSVSATKTVTVTDQDGNPLGHPVSATFPAGTQFTLPGGSTCPASTTEVCTLSVAFAPQSARTFQDNMVITDLTSGKTTTVQANGQGVTGP